MSSIRYLDHNKEYLVLNVDTIIKHISMIIFMLANEKKETNKNRMPFLRPHHIVIFHKDKVTEMTKYC